MKRHLFPGLLMLAAGLALAGPAAAQPSAVQPPQVVIEAYDLDSTTYVYPWSSPLTLGTQRIQTAGSSTTVTAVAGTPFIVLAVGDRIQVDRGGGVVEARTVATCVPACGPTATSITVTAAVDWTGGFTFSWRQVRVAAGAGDGWYLCSKAAAGSCLWQIQIEQQNTTTGIDFRLECDLVVGTEHKPPSVFEWTGVTAVGIGTAAAPGRRFIDVINPVDRCRLGFKMTSTDDGGDTGANAEIINVYMRTR